MNTRAIVEQLKTAGEDFEFYPTTESMLKVVYENMTFNYKTKILDIGCGMCSLKTFIDEHNEGNNEIKYYGIEKSEILISKLPSDVYILGTDFNNCTLIDKKVDVIFCNPPYSEFEQWTNRIIREGNFEQAFLIIPSRWQQSETIQQSLKDAKVQSCILSSDNFYNAERQARAVVDIVKFTKRRNYEKRLEVDPFDLWFKETFRPSENEDCMSEYIREEKEHEKLKNEIVSAKNKIETAVLLYNNEMERLYKSFQGITQLDDETLKDIGVSIPKVKESLRFKIQNTKIFYWNFIFDYLDEITSRLTTESRGNLKGKFTALSQVDFNAENIRSVVIWVLKNASSLYNEQLIKFYKTLTAPDNIIKYKSNQRVFQRDKWYSNRFEYGTELSHYCLSYRIISDNLYFKNYWGDEIDKSKAHTIIDDLCAIANNLGFKIAWKDLPVSFGEKYYIMQENNKPLIEFKIYKNGNTHLKLDVEFAKAINVEVSRLLGWIRNKSDIAAEFPDELAKGAEKYFNCNVNYTLTNSNLKLLS